MQIENTIIIETLFARREIVRQWLASHDSHLLPLLDMFEASYGGAAQDVQAARTLLSRHNMAQNLAHSSLKEKINPFTGLLPPPTPSELVEDGFPGHGYFWKSRGDRAQIDKHLAQEDADIIDDFVGLQAAHVVLADYALIRHDFVECAQMNDSEIDDWLLKQAAFISTGQVVRMQSGGDLCDLLTPPQLDLTVKKNGIRQRGGGRASSFVIDNDWERRAMLDVKGVGTCILQPYVELSMNGLLGLADALKEFAFERLLSKVSQSAKQWGTVKTYGIIDTGIAFLPGVTNPATGYIGEHCVLCVRQAQSRFMSQDDVVCYSVAGREHQATEQGQAILSCLSEYGISSEQCPAALTGSSSLDGDWNLQCDALMANLVDFSHWFVLPTSPLNPAWRMSHKAVATALQLGAEHMGVLESPQLRKLAFDESDLAKARECQRKTRPELEKKWAKVGKVGHRKPSHAWSWFLETDDSAVSA